MERRDAMEVWNKQAAEIRSRTKLIKLEELQEFIKSGEKMLFASSDIVPLKDHCKRAKQWINRLQEAAQEDAATAAAALEKLTPEVEYIAVDLSEHISSMQQATTVYCVCRLPYHGLMLGCDTCDDWYHAPCFGITKSQAERSDKFVCIRCVLKQAFAKASIVAAEAINTWVDPDAAIEALDQRRAKVSSAVARICCT